jgi:SAM-dependent methyltransferase
MSDPVEEFKAKQRETWALGNFGEAAVFTAQTAGHLVRFAGVRAGQAVLDVATGTGVVAITAARLGASVTGIDLTPELLAQAKRSGPVAGLTIAWEEADVERLPFGDGTFDVVLSQFGHMFAPRPDAAIREMLRVLKPGGRLAFATWPPETFVGRASALTGTYVTPPQGAPSPMLWGDVNVVRDRLGSAIKDLFFERGVMAIPALSPRHFLGWQTANIGPLIKVVGALQKEPAKLEAYLRASAELIDQYLVDNIVKHEYLLTRALKA